jgi:hypothetical protein
MDNAATMRNSRTYMIVLDAATIGDKYETTARFITTDGQFHHWWNYLPFTFMVTTDLDAEAISEALRPMTGTARFLVVAVNPSESEGRLPRAGWQWIRQHEQLPDRPG